MPINPLRSSARAKSAIAGVMALAAAGGGYITLAGGEKVPPQVVLAMDSLVEPWEGIELHAYLDKIAKPPVWTICAGDTQNVRAGMVETPAGCDKRLRVRLVNDYYKPLTKCISSFDDKPVSWGAMMISLSWNVGVGAACKSTAARLGREGRYLESCNAATAFNKAGGKLIIGLVNRREMGDKARIGEGELCVSGLNMVPVPAKPGAGAPSAPPTSASEVTPEPAIPAKAPSSLPAYGVAALFAAALAGIGFLIWRRRKKA